jgi:hypothetical protein
LSAALLCPFHGATVKNILFEDGDSANTLRVFNPTQIFLHLRKTIVIDPLRSAGQYTNYYIIT